MRPDDCYVVISSDCHAGGSMDLYREYLEPAFVDDFDAWRADYVVEFADLKDPTTEDYRRNHDGAIRQRDLEAEGVAGEVLFPNTIPPFFARHGLIEAPPSDAEGFRRSWAGLRAHNRWLADFCAELPGRRAGVAQVWLADLGLARAEVEWIRGAGLFGGILLPIPAHNGPEPPLHAPDYEPFWSLCEDLDVPITIHGGGGSPDEGWYASSGVVLFTTGGYYTLRPLAQLVMSGVFERHPRLRVALTETGSNTWPISLFTHLDAFVDRCARVPNSHASNYAGDAVRKLSLKPSEYFARNVWQGASFLSRPDCGLRDRIGVDRIMWGADYPHYEGTWPHSRAALQWTFQGVEPDEVQRMLAGNVATMYGFDVEVLRPLADRIGPTVAELAGPLDHDDLPPGMWSDAFDPVPRPFAPFP
jgi:predicted TIM-barrel fold metal-dependent hydrolase